jgi:hypothetical protein
VHPWFAAPLPTGGLLRGYTGVNVRDVTILERYVVGLERADDQALLRSLNQFWRQGGDVV